MPSVAARRDFGAGPSVVNSGATDTGGNVGGVMDEAPSVASGHI